MRKQRRLSDASAAVLALFVAEPDRQRFGLEVQRVTGAQSGSVYPTLHRFEEQKLLIAEWEPFAEAVETGRRPRRLYRLNPESAERASEALDEWRRERGRGGSLTPKPAFE